MDLTPASGVALGVIASLVYFQYVEKGIPTGSSCTYLSPWTTDLFAGLSGLWLVHRGFKHKDGMVTAIGMGVASLHVAQFAAHKVITNPKRKIL